MFTKPRGIVSVVQTPFAENDQLDLASLARLIEDALDSGVNGFLAPAVASEIAYLSDAERARIVEQIAMTNARRVPFIVGASANEIAMCQQHARLAERVGADAYLVAVPNDLYARPDQIVPFFQAIASANALPLIIQDLEWNGPGLPLDLIAQLRAEIPTLAGLKIETIPAGPKYSAVRALLGDDFFISGGWAIPQMIEALDRGVDAMIPESAMVRVYAAIDRLYHAGNRADALTLFRKLLPVLAFTNQEIGTSIAFFKRLLVRRGIFVSERMRHPGFAWDAHNARIADELIELYVALRESAIVTASKWS
ncbi:MAG: dihydrodipicolinate synthase family protein [Chloroflexi bacterium]|nr:dihydrodipicolinate synthase family protein [Chloroflexota bacterium]